MTLFYDATELKKIRSITSSAFSTYNFISTNLQGDNFSLACCFADCLLFCFSALTKSLVQAR